MVSPLRKPNAPRTVAPYHADAISPRETSPTNEAEEATKFCTPCLASLPLMETTRVEGTTALG
jgi:hypothetical protein